MKFYVDGSSSKDGGGAGVVVLTPAHEIHTRYALRFRFETTNNAGCKILRCMEVSRVKAYSDSALVFNQVNGSYHVKTEKLIKYAEKIKALSKQFEFWRLEQTNKAENGLADSVSKLASAASTELDGQVLLETLSRPRKKSWKQQRTLLAGWILLWYT